MWEFFNILLFVIGIGCAVWGIAILKMKKKRPLMNFIYAGIVFVINIALYFIPYIYKVSVVKVERNVVLDLFDSIGATIKQFVGESRPEIVSAYAETFPLYTWIFALCFALAVATSFFTALSVFGHKLSNYIKTSRRMNGDVCDIIVGDSSMEINYVKNNLKSVLLIDENTHKDRVISLIDDGCPVLKKRISVAFLKGRYFNDKTKYNIIYLNEGNNNSDKIDVILSYLKSEDNKKNVKFYVASNERVMEIIKEQILAKGTKDNKTYSDQVVLFSKNELIARTFVEQYPITKYMPLDFLKEDTSVMSGKKLNVFMLGFGDLAREMFKQFCINNQLTEYKDGEYRVFPLNYSIYDPDAERYSCELDELKITIDELLVSKQDYFPMPDIPYNTQCIVEKYYGMKLVKAISKNVQEKNGYSYIIIDTGDVYRNIEICNNFKLLLDKCDNYHIFMYNDSAAIDNGEHTSSYGDTSKILTHDTIVNESLVNLAKKINMVYLKDRISKKGIKLTEEELKEENEKDWIDLSYFDVYSNIYLANNLRLKLNLLGLDYVDDQKGENIKFIKEQYGTYSEEEIIYSDFFKESKRNALIAQEHFRWNAYHLLNGYLPNKKIRVGVSEADGNIKKDAKCNPLKKHACITTFKGLDELAQYLAQKAKETFGDKEYKAEDFQYYTNDELLIKVAPEFLQKEKCSVIKK